MSLWTRFQRFTAARLSPEGVAGAHLTLGVVMLFLGTLAFGLIADDVVSGAELVRLDVAVANWLHVRATPAMTAFMLGVSFFHGGIAGALLALSLLVVFYVRKLRWWLLAGMIILPGGTLLNVLIKYSFQRARPTFDAPLLTLTTYSFPSGHTAFAAMFYGLLACVLVAHLRGAAARAAVVLAAGAMVALVGLSRMYLGVHYLSDVLAATAEGCIWLAICITTVSTLRRRRLGRPD
ncbi:phosphatase PAP2 family protein [Massilia sp. DWR3-1-1]|uniref:phosphatase PAP2 family protein n=1 Tax=Massilia sp. DWR3-1-1 TaxID=2804559 RepID=UPI003CEB59B7